MLPTIVILTLIESNIIPIISRKARETMSEHEAMMKSWGNLRSNNLRDAHDAGFEAGLEQGKKKAPAPGSATVDYVEQFWSAIKVMGQDRGKEEMLKFLAESLMAGTSVLGGGETTYTNDGATVVVTVPIGWHEDK